MAKSSPSPNIACAESGTFIPPCAVETPVTFKLIEVHAPPTYNPSDVVTAAPAVLDLIVSAAMMDIYRPPIFRTSITTVLPEPTVIAIPEFTIISGLVVKT